MEIISMSQRKFKTLPLLELPKEVCNTESDIFEIRIKGKDKIFKRLHKQNGPLFANKLYNIEMLNDLKEYFPKALYIPEYLLAIGGKIEGPIIDRAVGLNLSALLNDKSIDTSLHMFFLKKIGELLNQLKYIRKTTLPLKNFYINDLQPSNFVANIKNGELAVIDLDSSKISDNFNFPARFLTPKALLNNVKGKYKINKDKNALFHVVADENTDLYCYIITILNYLYGSNLNTMRIEEFYEYLNYLEYLNINKELIQVFSYIVSNKDNENPYNLLDSITNEQIYRAKGNLFKALKKY